MMERVVRRSGRNKKLRTTKVSEVELDALIKEATVDTYNESELQSVRSPACLPQEVPQAAAHRCPHLIL
jgi:hypothetical protein